MKLCSSRKIKNSKTIEFYQLDVDNTEYLGYLKLLSCITICGKALITIKDAERHILGSEMPFIEWQWEAMLYVHSY